VRKEFSEHIKFVSAYQSLQSVSFDTHFVEKYRCSEVKYRMAYEKPARRLVDQRGRRSRTLHRKLNKCKCKVLAG